MHVKAGKKRYTHKPRFDLPDTSIDRSPLQRAAEHELVVSRFVELGLHRFNLDRVEGARGEAEIGQFDVASAVDEEVFGLKISVWLGDEKKRQEGGIRGGSRRRMRVIKPDMNRRGLLPILVCIHALNNEPDRLGYGKEREDIKSNARIYPSLCN